MAYIFVFDETLVAIVVGSGPEGSVSLYLLHELGLAVEHVAPLVRPTGLRGLLA